MKFSERSQCFDVQDDIRNAPDDDGDKQGSRPPKSGCSENKLTKCLPWKARQINDDSSPAATKGGFKKKVSGGLRTVLVKRDMSMVKILVLTTGTYLLLVAPMTILNVVDKCEQFPNVRNIVYSVYVWLYCVNFFIYVLTHPLYKKAYLRLLRSVCQCC
jgi:hypothetical protein